MTDRPSARGHWSRWRGTPRRRGLCWVLACALVAIPPAAHAQSTPLLVDPDDALARVLADLPGQPLGLVDALALALQNSPEVGLARADRLAAAGELRRIRGTFDPELFAEVTAAGNQNPSSSPFARPDVIETDETSTSTGARIQLPLGTRIEASLTTRRVDTNSEFASVDPEVRAEGSLEVRQPLLRGLGSGTSGARTSAARSAEAAAATYRDAVARVRADVERLYWSLYAAERDVAVQRLIVGQAEALLEQAQVRAQAGLVGPNEVATARVFMAQQRIAALDQEERLEAVSDELAAVLGVRPTSGSRFRPRDEPPRAYDVEALEGLLSRAYAENAELDAAERSLRATEALAAGAQRNRLPMLDLIGSVGGNGLAGTGREVTFGGQALSVDVKGGYGEALGQAVRREQGSWAVGLELSFPLLLREGRGERDRLQAEVERARHRVDSLRRSVEERVRAAHRELQNSQARLELAEEGVAASLDQVRIALIEYDHGRTTAFELSRLAADLAEAQQRLSDALVRAASAAADLSYLAPEAGPAVEASE